MTILLSVFRLYELSERNEDSMHHHDIDVSSQTGSRFCTELAHVFGIGKNIMWPPNARGHLCKLNLGFIEVSMYRRKTSYFVEIKLFGAKHLRLI